MTWVLAISIITINGLQIGFAIPIGSMAACQKAGTEQASAINGADEVKQTWWTCEQQDKSGNLIKSFRGKL